MNAIRSTVTALLGMLLCTCFSGCGEALHPQPLLKKVLVFECGDFGPELLVRPWLGECGKGAQVVVYYNQFESGLRGRYPEPGYRLEPLNAAIFHTNRILSQLPPGSPERARVRETQRRLLEFQRELRSAFLSVPPYAGRGSMRRLSVMP
jgi:hypothetical protein